MRNITLSQRSFFKTLGLFNVLKIEQICIREMPFGQKTIDQKTGEIIGAQETDIRC
jgi:hypothetical protein